jgi:excisionase family DNA binding protein
MEILNPTQVRDKEILTPEEMGVLLGVGRTTAYALLSTGDIPSFTVGRLRRVRRTDVDAYVEEQLEASRK